MRVLAFACCCCAVLPVGCAGQPGPPPDGEPAAGPGRFAHSAIHKAVAPWDGAAVQLFLAEKPMAKMVPVAPFVSVRVYRGVAELSGQRVRLGGEESRAGNAQWSPRPGQGSPLAWAEVRFEEIKEGEPVRGQYELAFPDGMRERGRFEAAWWPPEGRGG
jgi:hypothetical protein